jgi:hypothetical protein
MVVDFAKVRSFLSSRKSAIAFSSKTPRNGLAKFGGGPDPRRKPLKKPAESADCGAPIERF